MTRTPVTHRPIHHHGDLYRHWARLLGPLGFDRRSLWLGFIDADARMNSGVTCIEDLPVRADLDHCRHVLELCRHIVGDPPTRQSVAMLLTRGGRDPMGADDRTWGRGLTTAARERGLDRWPVHFANDEILQVFAPDDLVGGDRS